MSDGRERVSVFWSLLQCRRLSGGTCSTTSLTLSVDNRQYITGERSERPSARGPTVIMTEFIAQVFLVTWCQNSMMHTSRARTWPLSDYPRDQYDVHNLYTGARRTEIIIVTNFASRWNLFHLLLFLVTCIRKHCAVRLHGKDYSAVPVITTQELTWWWCPGKVE